MLNTTQNIFFAGKRTKKYTPHQKKQMSEIKKAAIQNGWTDVYTGQRFSAQNQPTIEHIIPCSAKLTEKVKQLKSNGFELNGLDNIFPVNSLENSMRQSEPFRQIIIKQPEILNRLLNELSKYSKFKSEHVDGKAWAKRLLKTISSELSGLASDLKIRKLIVF